MTGVDERRHTVSLPVVGDSKREMTSLLVTACSEQDLQLTSPAGCQGQTIHLIVLGAGYAMISRTQQKTRFIAVWNMIKI